MAAILLLACLALLLTAPVDGDFWWQDAPRHALNGAFIRDLVAAHPFGDPVRWAINYYLMRPALTIMFYPPLFYGIEAIAFQLFGFTHFVAQSTVMLFVLLLACAAYKLARTFLPRWSALGAALLAIGTPETAFWGRQVMLDVPAYALIATSTWCLVSYVKGSRPLAVYLAALFLLAAIYTKYNAAFVAPALAVGFVMGKGRTALRDRHAIIAAAMTAVGLVPALVIMLKFGARNLDSIASLPGTIPLGSLDCWLFYVEALPVQVGAITLAPAAGGLAVMFRRAAAARDQWIYALLLTWLVMGYLFFSLIALKEVRHDIMVLLPLASAAPLFLLAILPKPLGEAAGLTLGVATLVYTLAFCPVSRVGGYRAVADYLARVVPHDGLVVYAGYRDGNLIFNLATHSDRSDVAVIRVDKLLLSDPFGERRRGVKQADDDEATIAQMLRDVGGSYFVVQPGFWSDLAVMARFQAVINGADYQKVAHFDLTGNLSTQDGTKGIDILRPTYPVTTKQRRINIDMPIIGERFEGTSHQ
ncbi:ArnT family glycosyltransferase [Rhodopila sp.]|uniref:ArnT family glycosyltransferase n=1 Tax=Rhodopila sp. TaxID=2480087 RepID=UPI003D10F7BF